MGRSNELANAIRSFSASENMMRVAQGWLGLIEEIGRMDPQFIRGERAKSLQSQVENASVAIEQNL